MIRWSSQVGAGGKGGRQGGGGGEEEEEAGGEGGQEERAHAQVVDGVNDEAQVIGWAQLMLKSLIQSLMELTLC